MTRRATIPTVETAAAPVDPPPVAAPPAAAPRVAAGPVEPSPRRADHRRSELRPGDRRPGESADLWPPSRWPLGRRSFGLWVAAYLGLTALWSAVGLFVVSLESTAFGRADEDVARWFADQRTDSRTTVSEWVSMSADVRSKILIAVALTALFVALWRRIDEALLVIAVLLLEVSVFATTAAIVSRDRPPVEQLDGSLPTSSFPSGHVAATTALYVMLAVIVWRRCSSPVLRALAVAVGVLVPVAMAVARMYRGMHYLSDACFGVLLGLATVFVTWAVLREGRANRDRRVGEASVPEAPRRSEVEARP